MTKKFSVITLLAVFLLTLGGTSVFAQFINWESEPNNSFETADTAATYNYDNALNKGYLTQNDNDYWNFYLTQPGTHKITLQSPYSYNYDFILYETLSNGQRVELYRSNGDYYEDDIVTVSGLKPDGTVPNYTLLIFPYTPFGYNADSPYTLTIEPPQ